MPGLIGNRIHEATIRQGHITVIDEDGNERVRLGRVTIDSEDTYGVLVKDSAGETVLAADEFGLVYPSTPMPLRDAATFTAVTQADFTSVQYWAATPILTADAITAALGWSTDAATTGDIRIVLKAAPNTASAVVAQTEAVSLVAASNGTQVFNWLHGQALGSGPWYFGAIARRTSGAGNVNLFIPNYMAVIGSSAVSATATGL